MVDIEIHRGNDRGMKDLGWLKSRHSFAFGSYHNPDRMNYHTLRVLNDDIVEPGQGFGTHPHDNMEIITWVLSGELAHEDSTGTRRTLGPGEVQMMTAGSGLTHSEMNASDTERVHFLQIWIIPADRNVDPAYVQRKFAKDRRTNKWQLLISPDGNGDSLPVAQDASLRVADLSDGVSVDVQISQARHGYLHVATGEVQLENNTLTAGDAATFAGPADFTLKGKGEAQVLLFDLP